MGCGKRPHTSLPRSTSLAVRAAHLVRNANSAQFIIDEEAYAVFVVVPTSVQCCDVYDKVFTWQASDGSPLPLLDSARGAAISASGGEGP